MWRPDVIHSKCLYHGGRKAFERTVFCVEGKVSFSYLMNRCLHNTAHPTDGGVISSHYGGLQEGRDLCGRTERLTSSPPDRAHGGPLTRVVLPEKPKVGFPFHEVSS